MLAARVTAPPCSDATFSEELTLLVAVGCGTARPLLPNEFPTMVDARNRLLQLVLFTRTINYAAEILAHLQMSYAFHSTLAKLGKTSTRRSSDAPTTSTSQSAAVPLVRGRRRAGRGGRHAR